MYEIWAFRQETELDWRYILSFWPSTLTISQALFSAIPLKKEVSILFRPIVTDETINDYHHKLFIDTHVDIYYQSAA